MGKALSLLGLIMMILEILPLILPLLGSTLGASFYLGLYTLPILGYDFSELILILLIVGFLVLLVGAFR
ncbi:MAG: hypothetical protein P1Q69_12870 [Candidatus Thorarchaeota archaeon]|nr:hypothetical protein [Candidatus Thorarchaeota archaeon]